MHKVREAVSATTRPDGTEVHLHHKVVSVCEKSNDSTEYKLFVRCLSEQTIVENQNRRLLIKEDSGMKSSMMQSPSDPEAAFRSKAGKEH